MTDVDKVYEDVIAQFECQSVCSRQNYPGTGVIQQTLSQWKPVTQLRKAGHCYSRNHNFSLPGTLCTFLISGPPVWRALLLWFISMEYYNNSIGSSELLYIGNSYWGQYDHFWLYNQPKTEWFYGSCIKVGNDVTEAKYENCLFDHGCVIKIIVFSDGFLSIFLYGNW